MAAAKPSGVLPGILHTGAGGKDVFSGVEAVPPLLSSCWEDPPGENAPPPPRPQEQRETHVGEGAQSDTQVQPPLTRRPEGRDLEVHFALGQGLLHSRYSNICWMNSSQTHSHVTFLGTK